MLWALLLAALIAALGFGRDAARLVGVFSIMSIVLVLGMPTEYLTPFIAAPRPAVTVFKTCLLVAYGVALFSIYRPRYRRVALSMVLVASVLALCVLPLNFLATMMLPGNPTSVFALWWYYVLQAPLAIAAFRAVSEA